MSVQTDKAGLSTEEPNVTYPIDTKCCNCGFTFGDHHKVGAWCPSGPRDRKIGFTRYSDEYYFVPALPRLPAAYSHAMFAFTDQSSVVSHLANRKDKTPELLKRHDRVAMKYKFALFSMIRALIDENRELKKKLKQSEENNQCKLP